MPKMEPAFIFPVAVLCAWDVPSEMNLSAKSELSYFFSKNDLKSCIEFLSWKTIDIAKSQ